MANLLEGHRTEEQKRQIAADINETDDDKLGYNIAVLEAWMKTQPHLPQNYDRRILPFFIRGCKHNLEIVKRKLDTYFSIRNLHPNFFKHRDPYGKDVQKVLETCIIAPISTISPDGLRITFYKLASDIADFHPVALFKTILMMAEIRLAEEKLIKGDCFVWDLGTISMKHVASLACHDTKKILQYASEAYPQRMQQIHVINCTPIAEKLTNFVKMIMKPKIRNRVVLHSDPKTLGSCLPPECIPSEYGGTAPSLSEIKDSWKQKLYDYSDWFLQQETIRTDESKRPAEAEWNPSQMGVDVVGTFRQIQID